MADEKILEVKDLRISFNVDSGTVKAVRGISFDLKRGKTLCIVGESGSGKSVTSRAILGILAKNAIIEGGEIIYDGKDLLTINEDRFHKIRGSKISMIFQDPLSALNPIMRVGKQLTEPIFLKAKANRREAKRNVSFVEGAISDSSKKHGLSIDRDLLAKFKKETMDLLANDIDKEDALRHKTIKERYVEMVSNPSHYPSKTVDMARKYLFLKGDRPTEPNPKPVEALSDAENAALLSQLEKLIEAGYEDYEEALRLFHQLVDDILAKELAGEVGDLEALKQRIDPLKSATPAFAFRDDEDDRIAVFATSFAKYVRFLKKAIRHEEKQRKAKEWYAEKGQEVPPLTVKQRAKLPEHFITPEEATGMLKELCQKLISHIDRVLAQGLDYKAYSVRFLAYYREVLSAAKRSVNREEAKETALEIMRQVGIPQPEIRFRQYPFEFSGGMRQRMVIAIALSSRPEILICDEPTTALDVTIQAQILELINKLKDELNLSIIFITHDLGVVANMADDIAVMYAGKIVEYGTVDDIFYDPRHPYTWALLASMPDLDTKQKIDAIPGTPPNMVLPPIGDAFAARNKYALALDFEEEPPLFAISDTHYAATWLLREDAPKAVPPEIVTERIARAMEKRGKSAKKGGK